MEAKGAEKEDKLPPGFRFHPTDEELITHYLVKKIADTHFTGRAITDADLNKCEPWDLPGKAKMGEKEWYFFSLRDRKYPTGVRTNRATNAGYWKTTGKDKEIFSSSSSRNNNNNMMASSYLVGMKKTLVFYRGRAPRGEKSNWVMHEYRRHCRSSLPTLKDEWVVCRVFQKNEFGKKYTSTSFCTQTSREGQYNLEVHPGGRGGGGGRIVNSEGKYITITDITGIATNSSSSSSNGVGGIIKSQHSTQNVNFSLFSPSKNFTISGLNLNLGRGLTVPLHHHNYYPPPSPPPPTHGVVQVHQSDAIFAAEAGSYQQQQVDDGREMTGVEQCLDLDAFWPTF